MDILRQLFHYLSKITKITVGDYKNTILFRIICKYITVFHNIHEDEIELALFSNNLHQRDYKMIH